MRFALSLYLVFVVDARKQNRRKDTGGDTGSDEREASRTKFLRIEFSPVERFFGSRKCVGRKEIRINFGVLSACGEREADPRR